MAAYSVAPVVFAGVSQVTATRGVNDPEVGYLCNVGDESYIFVYNDGNSQISPGLGAIVSINTGYSVTVSSVTGGDVAIGVCVHATLTTGTYGWLLTRGFCNIKATADSGISAGARVVISNDGTWTQPTSSSNVSNLQNYFQGKCMVATASGGTAVAYMCIF